jgi:SAM-dependent methyltransferase
VATKVDPSNAEQARAWDGDEGAFWAAHADHFDRALAGYHADFMATAAVSPTDRVLDVGCGTGQTTRAAARLASAGSALGVDLSGRMIEVAQRLAADEGVRNVGFEQADAQVETFAPPLFDLVISRTGTMFFGDAVAAFANLNRALRPDGRLAILVWQGIGPNEWMRELSGALAAGRDLGGPVVGAPGPFAMADPDDATNILAEAGFEDVEVDGLDAPMWFGSDPAQAQAFVLGLMGWMLHGLDDVGQARARDALTATLEAHCTSDGVTFGSATWLISARV